MVMLNVNESVLSFNRTYGSRPTRLLSHCVLSSSGPPLPCCCGSAADARSCGMCWRHSQAPPSVTDGHLTEISSVRLYLQPLLVAYSLRKCFWRMLCMLSAVRSINLRQLIMMKIFQCYRQKIGNGLDAMRFPCDSAPPLQ